MFNVKGMPARLPPQSGSDTVLKRMARRYDRAGYVAAVERARAACPDVAVAADWIVGFPGAEEVRFRVEQACLGGMCGT